MRRFDGKAVFITGAAHGIGRATAIRLAQEGARVALADVDLETAQTAAEAIGDVAWAVPCDVRQGDSVDAAIAASVERFGRLDVLVATAGGDTPEPPFAETDDALWQRLVDFNLISVMRCIRAALPHLLASGGGGNVVAIGSVNGLAAFGSYPYSAAKAGLQNLMKNLAAEYGHQGLRFNLVAPGTIRTRVWDTQPGSLDRLKRLYPLGRVGEPEDIAAAVAFLASADAAWITGTTLPVDGGILTGPRGILFSHQDSGEAE
jgi:NAD(P)-dependent dehydrogenase (short-subunit alcohol dehydrogenase family)